MRCDQPGGLSLMAPQRAIVVKDAKYRGNHFEGVFVLAEDEEAKLPASGWHKVQVYFYWFENRLKARCNIVVDMATTKVIDIPHSH